MERKDDGEKLSTLPRFISPNAPHSLVITVSRGLPELTRASDRSHNQIRLWKPTAQWSRMERGVYQISGQRPTAASWRAAGSSTLRPQAATPQLRTFDLNFGDLLLLC